MFIRSDGTPRGTEPLQGDNVQAAKSSGAQGNPRSTPPFLGGLGGSQSPEPPFSLVPSTARSLFGGTKRECGVGTVGSERCHALADRSKYKACGAVLSTDGKYPKVAEGLSMPLRLLTTTCLGGLRSPWPGRAYPLGTGDEGRGRRLFLFIPLRPSRCAKTTPSAPSPAGQRPPGRRWRTAPAEAGALWPFRSLPRPADGRF